MFCPNCGGKREVQQRFCTSCGEMLEEKSAGEEFNTLSQDSITPLKSTKKGLRLNKPILVILLVLLIGGGYMFKTQSTNLDSNSPEGVVQKFLTSINELDIKSAFSVCYIDDDPSVKMISQAIENDETLKELGLDITDLAVELKKTASEELGENFHKPDEIKIIEDNGDQFTVRVSYEKSNKNKDSLKNERTFSVMLKDGKYYINGGY